MNNDGGIGIEAALTAVAADTTGARLKRDSENSLYIDKSGQIISIVDQSGGAHRFDDSNSWQDGTTTISWAQESVAVEEQSDGSFKLAVKNTNTWGSESEINWSVYSISKDGVLDWSSSYFGGITKQETYFAQDLNADGGIGLSASLTSISSDTTGATLQRDSEDSLYIQDGTKTIPIVDSLGGSPSFNESNIWTVGGNTSSWSEVAYAVEYISDHNLYQFAVKTTDTYTTSSETTTDIKWNIYTVDSSGLLSSTPNVYKGISKHEAAFNQDMNNDGAIGFSADSLISFCYGHRRCDTKKGW